MRLLSRNSLSKVSQSKWNSSRTNHLALSGIYGTNLIKDPTLLRDVPDEVTEDGTVAQKIYDSDITCSGAKELYEKICQESCNFVATREF